MADEYLEHYGVLGMKWGVRKDPQKAYQKSMNKLKKLDKKVQKREAKSAKFALKSAKKEEKAFRTSSDRKYRKQTRKALRYKRKSANQAYKSKKATAKAKAWVNSMNDYLADVKVSDISSEDIAIGRTYAVKVLEDYLKD